MKPLPPGSHFGTRLVVDVVILGLMTVAFPAALATVVGSPASVRLPEDWFSRPRLSEDLAVALVAVAGWVVYAVVALTFVVELAAVARNTVARETVLTRELQRTIRRRVVGAQVAALVLVDRAYEDDHPYPRPPEAGS